MSLVLSELSKYTPVVSLCPWYWGNCENILLLFTFVLWYWGNCLNILRLFHFVLGTDGIVKIYPSCFLLSLILWELSKYTPVVSVCPWYCGNYQNILQLFPFVLGTEGICQNILRLFPFVLGSEGIVKIYSSCFPLSFVLKELSKYTAVVSVCQWYWDNF